MIENYLQFNDENFFQAESTINPTKKQVFGEKSLKNLLYANIYVETLLQSTAFLSYLTENEKALEKAEKCYKILKLIFKAYS